MDVSACEDYLSLSIQNKSISIKQSSQHSMFMNKITT